ncbi:MAG: hypothetical protein KF684_02500 [Phycisphaeraceae bacterium]|nr:hypothetical protein [Phycisphaeraceae bacterium]
MNAPPKAQTLLQAYRVLFYRRALHPELFKVCNRIAIVHRDYEFEGWVLPGSHVLRFQHNGACAVELLTNIDGGLPDRGVIAGFPAMGERDHEQRFDEGVRSVFTVQTETLADNLFNATYRELVDFARDNDAATHLWTTDDGGRCASILDVQRYRKEIHIQSYHLLAIGGIVIRSQTIFEHA